MECYSSQFIDIAATSFIYNASPGCYGPLVVYCRWWWHIYAAKFLISQHSFLIFGYLHFSAYAEERYTLLPPRWLIIREFIYLVITRFSFLFIALGYFSSGRTANMAGYSAIDDYLRFTASAISAGFHTAACTPHRTYFTHVIACHEISRSQESIQLSYR